MIQKRRCLQCCQGVVKQEQVLDLILSISIVDMYIYIYIYIQFSQSLWIYPQLDIKWIAPPLPLSSPGKTTGIKISCAEPWFWRDQQPMYLCIYVSMYVCMYGWMYVCMDVCMYVCICIYIYIFVYI